MLTFTSDPGLNNVVTLTPGGTHFLITDSGAAIDPGPVNTGCGIQSTHAVVCPLAGTTKIVVRLGDLDDIFWSLISLPTDVMGDGGNDDLTTGGGADLLFGGLGSDVLRGGGGDDTLFGESFAFQVAGEGNNQLYGGEGSDTLYGAANDDLLEGGGFATDYLDCAGGLRDVVSYANSAAGVSLSLQLTNAQYTGRATGLERILNCEDIVGSAFDDLLEGDGADNQLWGNGGPDTLKGFGGTDWLSGGPGGDTLHGGAGNDYLFGDADNDTLFDNTDGEVDFEIHCGAGTGDVAWFDVKIAQWSTDCESTP